jgi:acyl dehydratase
MTLHWDSVNEGDVLPQLRKRPGVTQLVKYSAGSGDFNPLHHDYDFPQCAQLGTIIVHGRFKYAALGELVSNWLGHAGRIKKLSCQYRGMDVPDKEFTCTGKVTRKYEQDGEKLVDLQLAALNEEGQATTPGQAVVVLKS